MDDKAERQREVERAHQASRILDCPLWAEVWDGYRGALLDRMTSPATLDDDVLVARRMLVAVEQVQSDLTEILTTGELAQMQLEEAKNERSSTAKH